jgi:hypothetical protein
VGGSLSVGDGEGIGGDAFASGSVGKGVLWKRGPEVSEWGVGLGVEGGEAM